MDWKTYRADYDTLPVKEHRKMYEGLAVQNRDQSRFSGSVAQTFAAKHRPKHVVELGGWDGELAQHLMTWPSKVPSIRSWANFELSDVEPVCTHPRFNQIVEDDWAWDSPAFVGDAFFSSHSLEHISAEQVELLLGRLDRERFKTAFIQIPLPMNGKPDWEQWPNSGHILQMNMTELDAAFEAHGWTLDLDVRMGIDYIRGWVK